MARLILTAVAAFATIAATLASFPGTATVLTPLGRVRLSDVRLGDLVLAPSGFVPVLAFATRAPATDDTFFCVAVTRPTPARMCATPSQYVYLNDTPVALADAQIGDLVNVRGAPSKIAAVFVQSDRGIFDLHLRDHTYFVDDIAVHELNSLLDDATFE